MNTELLKQYLSGTYKGVKSFLNNIIFPIFGEEDFVDEYETELLEDKTEKKKLADATGISSIKQVGKIYVDVTPLQIFDVTVKDSVMMERNRVSIQRLIRSVMDQFSCAFMIFHYSDDSKWDWRFTYCRKNENNEEMTDSKRYTFLLGPGQACRTAAENFMSLYEKGDNVKIEDIEDAFNVEALSKEFFAKYKSHYLKFVDFISDPENGMRDLFIDRDFDATLLKDDVKIEEREEKPIRDYVKKLLGRIVFLHFLQKKGWLGVPAGEDWGNGDKNFMLHLFENASDDQKNDFLDQVLEPLFSKALDTYRDEESLFDTKVEGFRNVRIPYLNGGLFERDPLDDNKSYFPSEYFEELLTMLSQYNFTIDENDPNDAEVGVDPEMLGRIFENLLEDNKDKGAFYTPKEIVQYMCRESLIAYLQEDKDERDKKIIRDFVLYHNATLLGDLVEDIDQKLKDVKICDPAIGSGAFPMGLLRELFYCRSAIEPNIVDNAADIKRHIIQNNIYGVDIEKGAVEIARLRFWLSLIVDEKSPVTLPNLDFKIMRGNSLLEQYQGVDLSELVFGKNQIQIKSDYKLTLFDDEIDLLKHELSKKLDEYYECDNHTQRVILRSEIAELVQQQLIANQYNISLDGIDIHSNDQFFLWHTWFNDVFSRPSKEGFDIVIGNPPYRQLQSIKKMSATYKKCGYDSYIATGDIYCLFYEFGVNLLRKNGILCYITSNKWMRAAYGEKVRKFFSENTNPKQLTDFAGVKIFENATVDTNILLIEKSENNENTIAVVADASWKSNIDKLSYLVQQKASKCAFNTSNSWIVLSPIEMSIKKKIEAVGIPLKDWDIQINYGIKTGYNEAFIINSEKRNEILNNCIDEAERKRTEEIIRPILRGRDIKRYGYEWAELWLIATFPSCNYDINDYPSLKQYLLSFGVERLEQTGRTHLVNGERIKSRKKTNNKWFETQDSISYWEEFNKPKIIYPNMTKYMPFVLDNKLYLTNQKCFIITGKYVAYLTAFFNSSLFKFCFRDSFPELQGGTRELSKIFFEKIPACKVTEVHDLHFQEAIEDIQREYTKEKALRIDSMIFDLYNLTQEERDIIGFVEIR